jgi:hypothetical protein
VAKGGGGTATSAPKRQLERGSEDDAEEDIDAKRRRILEETRDIDADLEAESDEDSNEDDRLVLLNYSMNTGLIQLVTTMKMKLPNCSGSWRRSSVRGRRRESKKSE